MSPRRLFCFKMFMLFAVIMLLCLGTWQVKRLQWKEALVASVEAAVTEVPLTMEELLATESPAETLRYRRVEVKGRFLHEQEIHLFTGQKAYKGKVGYDVLTPVLAASGAAVLVDRGWVPSEMKDRNNRAETVASENASLIAMVMPGEHPGLFTPENDKEKNLWFWIDIPAIAATTGVSLPPYYVRALQPEGEEPALPRAGEAHVELLNDHLNYAITWYSLAIIAGVIYVLAARKARSL